MLSDINVLPPLELVVGRYHELFNAEMTAFTKWCPAEDEDKSFARAEKAIDLALTRMGQKEITLLQCMFSATNFFYGH